jgi:hypothetical protein
MWRLGTRGRVVVRASGTEPVVRLTAEAEDEALGAGMAEGLAALVRACAASPEPVQPAAGRAVPPAAEMGAALDAAV